MVTTAAEETRQLITAFINIHNVLGPGLQQKFYLNALETELLRMNLPHRRLTKDNPMEQQIKNEMHPDFIAFNNIAIRILTTNCIEDKHRFDMYEILESTDFPVGVLVTFGCRRILFENVRHPRK